MSSSLPRLTPEKGKSWASPAYLYGASRPTGDGDPRNSDDTDRHHALGEDGPLLLAARKPGVVSARSAERQRSQLVRQFLASSNHPTPATAAAATDTTPGRGEGPTAWNSMLHTLDRQAAAERGASPNSTLTGPQGATAAESQGRISRKMVVDSVDSFLTRCGASYVQEPERCHNYCKGLDDLGKVYPNLGPIFLQLSRYLRELASSTEERERRHAQELRDQEKQLFKKFEEFFEKKMLDLVKERNAMEAAAKAKYDEAFALRKERDEDIMAVKRDLMRRLNECEKREDEFRSFRRLIASVFQTNEQLTSRIEDLEALLSKNRIDVPPPLNARELYAYSKKSTGAPVVKLDDDVKPLSQQVPIEFIEASREEMTSARLALQNELIYSAFDDRSAYRLQVNNLKNENSALELQVSQLKQQVTELNSYIHQKRFLYSSGGGDGDVPMTPRPRDVPFGIQTDLGIDLRRSTSDIISELSAVAMNLKHQLNSSMLRLRQANTFGEWMQEETMIELDEERNGIGSLPTFPVKMWPNVPHFLRTHIEPDVINVRWTEVQTGALLYEFFDKYAALRDQCRYVRDSKMVRPRRCQLYERRELADLSRLDATKEELEEGEKDVPFGYVVSHFIYTFFINLRAGSTSSQFVLPGTLNSHFRVREEEKVTELEFTRFAYNLWWHARRYYHTQPLCRLFVDINDGKMPVEAMGLMRATLERVRQHVSALDSDGSHTFAFPKLVKGVLRLVDDMDAQAGRCASLALAQTFEANEALIMGGRISMTALFADERFFAYEGDTRTAGGSKQASSAAASSALPATITPRYVQPKTHQPLGASVFVRYWERLVIERVQLVYDFVERCVAPLVEESAVVVGLYLLPVPEALRRVQGFDADLDLKARELALGDGALLFPDDSCAPPNAPDAGDEELATYNEAENGMPQVTKNFDNLIRERREVWLARRAAEGVRLEQIVTALFDRLPRLNRSVHFPFQDERPESPKDSPPSLDAASSPTSPEAKPVSSGGGRKKKAQAASEGKSKKSKRKKNKEAVTTELVIHVDHEVVEWYGFCAELRRQPPLLSEHLFSKEEVVEAADGSV